MMINPKRVGSIFMRLQTFCSKQKVCHVLHKISKVAVAEATVNETFQCDMKLRTTIEEFWLRSAKCGRQSMYKIRIGKL